MPAEWSDRWTRNEDGSVTRNLAAGRVVSEYESMSKADLVEELEYRGLPKTGNKAELIARLEEADAL